jgi:FkbM family methyltransferase
LETKYDWRGICVEPTPSIYNQLVINRPNSHCSDNAVYSVSNATVIFDIAHCSNLLSGISDLIDRHKSRIDASKTSISVNTITLTDLLDKYEAPKFIEYLSLDTEGSEYEILRVFDFSKYTFGLIDVEHNHIEPRRTQIRELLTSNGYDYIGPNHFDDMYKHKSI